MSGNGDRLGSDDDRLAVCRVNRPTSQGRAADVGERLWPDDLVNPAAECIGEQRSGLVPDVVVLVTGFDLVDRIDGETRRF